MLAKSESCVLAGELCNTVQDAFVIAVEQQARDRLQRLSALKRITPVDITQLSIKVFPRSQTIIIISCIILISFGFHRNRCRPACELRETERSGGRHT